MINLWNNLDTYERIMMIIAVPASLLLLFQAILSVIGFGGDSVDSGLDSIDHDSDLSGSSDGLAVFSIKGISAFFAIGGFFGLVVYRIGIHYLISTLFAFAVGIAALFGVAFAFKAFMKLQSDGNIHIANAVGKTGQVYIPIPASGNGTGKITVTFQDKFVEMDALTNREAAIPTGEIVNIVDTYGNSALIVEPFDSKIEIYEYNNAAD